MHAASFALCLDSVYHYYIHFIFNKLYSMHHCVLFHLISWPSLSLSGQRHMYSFMYKSIVDELPFCVLKKKTFKALLSVAVALLAPF